MFSDYCELQTASDESFMVSNCMHCFQQFNSCESFCMSVKLYRENKIIDRNALQNKQGYEDRNQHIIYVDQKKRVFFKYV
jgi:hypothetical protein